VTSEGSLKRGHKDRGERNGPGTETEKRGYSKTQENSVRALRGKLWRTFEAGFYYSLKQIGMTPQHRDSNNLSASDGSFGL